MPITEHFLHYIWKFRLFDQTNLTTTEQETIEIISPGLHNHDSGPDFSNARIKIGNTIWAGNVEIHLTSADWDKHNHQTDPAYHNVILHVVYRHNKNIRLNNNRILPTLELSNLIPESIINKHMGMVHHNFNFIPCESSIGVVDGFTINNWLSRILVERLENRTETVIASLQYNKGDWAETFYQFLARGFGFKVNALPFELLAKSLPQSVLSKHKNNALQIEALLFGQAGMLDADFAETYPVQLKTEYDFLRQKYRLTPIDSHLWKFSRTRPQNFPTIRLAQFAALIYHSNHLFSQILELRNTDQLAKLLTVQPHTYWDNHFTFDQSGKHISKKLGSTSVNNLLLNVFVLFLFAYGNYHQQQHYVDRALKMLECLPPEHNNIMEDFSNLGLRNDNAFTSQALLELKKNYCDDKKCLQCGVGIKILKLSR